MFFPDASPLVTWQGFPCSARGGSFRFSRTPGFSSDSGTVEVPIRQFQNARVAPNLEKFFDDFISRGGGTRVRVGGKEGGEIPTGKKFGISGDLVMKLGNDQVLLPDIYLKEDGMEEVIWTEKGGDGPLIRIAIADIRYWWGSRGTTPFIRGNWRKPDGSFQEETFNPDTGKPWQVREYIERLLGALPGRPRINRFPDGLDIDGPRVDWPEDSPLAMDALRRLARQYGIIMTLDVVPPGFVSFWRNQEGKIGHGSNNAQALPPAALVQDPKSVSFSFPPEAVKVFGPATLIETQVELEPAAVTKDGTIMSLADWLNVNFKLSIAEAGRLVLQNPRTMKERLSDKEAKLFRAQAFRVYRLPEVDRRTKLPIRDRLQLDTVGRRFPPLVEADGFSENRQSQSSDGGTDSSEEGAGTQGEDDATRSRGVEQGVAGVKPADQAEFEKAISVVDKLDRIIAEKAPQRRRRLRDLEKVERDAVGELVIAELKQNPERLAAARDNRLRAARDVQAAKELLNQGDARTESAKTFALNVLAKLKPKPAADDRFVNLPIDEVSASEVQIDHKVGIVKFTKPRGTLTDVTVEAKEMSGLNPAKARITFAHPDLPEKDGKPLSSEQLEKKHYIGNFVWNKGTPKQVDKLPSTIFPRPIERNNLQLNKFLDGTDNRKELDTEAKAIADSVMKVKPDVFGSAPIIATFIPVNCNGKVLGVKWSSDGLRAVTEIQASASRRGPGAPGNLLRQALSSTDRTGRTIVRIPGGTESGIKEKEIFDIIAAAQSRENG